MRDAVHEATHRVPGVAPHEDYPKGHQGATVHGRSAQGRPLQNRATGARYGRRHDRAPRVLVGWQNWIAGLFSRTAD